MIRTIIIVLFVVLFLILTIPVLLIEWIIGKFNPNIKSKSSLKIVQWAFRRILGLSGTQLHVIGRENIPDDRPVLYVGNHRSYFDIVIGYTLIKGQCGFVAKKEMEKIPLLSIWMKYLHCQFLDREDLKAGLKTILACIDKVKAGISIWIFPEGTRNSKGEGMLEFKEGSLKIAEKSKCLIIPVAMWNTGEIFEAHLPFVHPAKITVKFGAPIDVSSLEREQKKFLGAYTETIIKDMLSEIQSLK